MLTFPPDGTIAFATPAGFADPINGHLVKVINADTGQVIGEIDIGFVYEAQIERRPNSSLLYIGPCDFNRKELLIIDDSTASALDLDANTPGIQGIPLPESPWKMEFSPDGRFAYATRCTGSVSGLLKIDLAQNVYVKTIPTQQFVNSVAVSTGGTLAVVAGGGNATSIIDLATDTEIGVHHASAGSNDGVAIDIDRQRAYVLNNALGLLGLNIADPTNPTLSSITNLSSGAVNESPGQSLRRVGDRLYATLATDPTRPQNSLIVVLDISVEPPQILVRQAFGIQAFSEVVVRPAAPAIISINNIPTSAVFGGNFTPTFTYAGTGKTSATSSTFGQCTVASNGVVSFVGVGTCTLTARATNMGTTVATGDPQSFNINQASTTISIKNIPKSARVGKGFTPTFSYTGDGSTSVTSSTATCSVSGSVVTFLSAGTCTLTAHATAGVNYQATDGSSQSFTIR